MSILRKAVVVVAMMAGLGSLPAAATPQEDAYIAARDKYLKQFEKADPEKDKNVDKEQERAIADLQKQLEAIIGPIAVKGFDPKPRNNIDTLMSGDDTFGHLDGLAFGPLGNQRMLMVSTEGLMKNWLKSHQTWWGEKEAKMPQTPGAALKTEGFYTQAIGFDSAFQFYAELPIVKPASASFAVSYLYITAQDFGPWKPNEILVSVLQGGKLYIVSMPAKTAIPKYPACDAIFKAAEKKSAKSDDFDAIRGKGDADYRRCFAEQASKAPFFPKLVAEAQALVDALPPK